MTELVRMMRTDECPPPHSADVHVDEVENYKAGGWIIAESVKPRRKNAKTTDGADSDADDTSTDVAEG